MADAGADYTDETIREMEKKLRQEYRQATREVQDKLDNYLQQFAGREQVMRAKLDAGEITAQEYQSFMNRQVMMGKRWADMQQTLAEDLHHANQIAASTVRGYMPEVYAVNHNYGTYQVEQLTGVDTSYTLYDRQTVERLMRDNPEMLPPPGRKASARIAAGEDVRWNRQQIQSVMTQGILQGKSIPELARSLEQVTERNYHAAVRNARTMATGAQNAGRVDSYKRAQDMGIKLQQRWLATLDNRTRHEHRLLHGMTVDVGEPFLVEGEEIRFPGDPLAEPHLVYNCRCTLVSVLPGHERGITMVSPKMAESFEEWQNGRLSPAEAERNERALDEIRRRIESGQYSTELTEQEYAKHVEGTDQYRRMISDRGRDQSKITISFDEAQKLIKQYSGTGIVRKGGFTVEYCSCNKVVGTVKYKGRWMYTTRFALHHAENGTHLVPVRERGW